jgi:hypothetical protein
MAQPEGIVTFIVDNEGTGIEPTIDGLQALP